MKTFFSTVLFSSALALLCLNAYPQAVGTASNAASQKDNTPAPQAFNDPLAPAGWKRYEFQIKTGNVLSVFLPALPEGETSQHAMGSVGTLTNYTYTASTARDVYVISYMIGLPPEATNNAQIRATMFESFWRGFANGIKRSLESKGLAAEIATQAPQKKMEGPFEVQEQDFSIGTMAGTARAVLSGSYGYATVVISLEDKPGDEYKSFLNSFSLRARR